MMRASFVAQAVATLALAACSGEPGAPSPAASAPASARVTLPFRAAAGGVRHLQLEVLDGRAFLGDMGFGRPDDLRPRSLGLSGVEARWRDGIVTFCFYEGEDLGLVTPTFTRPVFRTATAYLTERVPRLRFVDHDVCKPELNQAVDLAGGPPPLWDEDVLVVMRHRSEDWSRAEKGRMGGAQGIWLQQTIGESGDNGRGTVVHELGHTLGLGHEHQRSDRDTFVEVCDLNVGRPGDFAILDTERHEQLTPYDYHSRMHYAADHGRIDDPLDVPPCGRNTLHAKLDTLPDVPGADAAFGLNPHLSIHDINALSLMYGTALGTSRSGDRYGESVAVADFDQDGYDDVVVGSPGELSAAGSSNAGSVFVYKGTERFPAPRKLLLRHPDAAEQGDKLGSTLAVGDFDGDKFPDLAVGIPGARRFGQRSGAVLLYRGGRFRSAVYRRNTDGDCGTYTKCVATEADALVPWRILWPSDDAAALDSEGDAFGAALVFGDFDGDGNADLAVGAPGKSQGAGRVFVYAGADLAVPAVHTSSQGITRFGGSTATRFGASLAAGNFDGAGGKRRDLAVGADGGGRGGEVFVFAGTGNLPPAPMARLHHPAAVVIGTDGFGATVAAGRLIANGGADEIVVAAPRQRNASGVRSGAVHVFAWDAAGSGFRHRQRLSMPATTEERFGHAIATLDTNSDTIDDLVVGAPLSGGRGRVVIFTSDGTSLTVGPTITAGNFRVQFGGALAVGATKVHMPGFPAAATARLFVGAPESVAGTVPLAGRADGYGFTDGTPVLHLQMRQETKSPWMADAD